MSTGQRIKERRKQLALSAEKLAKFLNVSPATVYRWEKGEIEKVPMSILTPLSDILQTTPEYLMEWSDNPDPSPVPEKNDEPPDHPPLSSRARILAQGFDQLPPEAQQLAQDMFDLMFEKYIGKEDPDNDA